MPALRSFWDHQVLRPAETAHRLSVGGRSLLFDDRGQQLFEPNDSAAAIWDALVCEGTPAGAARLLAGADDAVALDFVRAAAADWLRAGLLRPAALDAEGGEPLHELRLGWLDRRLVLDLRDEGFVAPLNEVFAPFRTDRTPQREVPGPDARLGLRRIDDLVFISDAWGSCARSEDEWLPEVKARFTSEILRTETSGFLAHAALLSKAGRGLLLCGAPGAGKTTLAVGLTLAGFGYHADDIVWIGEDGGAVGAPFAPALKEGSWPLIAETGADAATYLRGDGQKVRYLPTPAATPGPVAVGAILLLDRQAAGPAAIEPVHPLEALTAILSCAYSARAAISAPALKALAAVVQDARVGRLQFSDWREARALVEDFTS